MVVVNETYGAERCGYAPTVRWAMHSAALEFREVGRLRARLADLIVHNLRRPLDEPRTALPNNAAMHLHYRQWAHR